MRTLLLRSATIGLALVGLAGVAHAQTAPATVAQQITEGVTTMLEVASNFDEGGAIADRHSAYFQNQALPVEWGEAPDGTQSIAIVLEDVVPGRDTTVQHWIAYNIPGNEEEIPAGLPNGNKYYAMAPGVLQATNRDIIGYRGPRPPAGETHNYVLQVFALDTKLEVKPEEVNTQTLVEAAKGHVLAYGVLNGTYMVANPPA